MDYLVTTNSDLSIEGYKSVNSLSEIITADSSSVIVLHSFTEDEYKASLTLTDLYRKRGIYKFIYINEFPLDGVGVLIDSFGGVLETDETLLEDVDELDMLISLVDTDKLEVLEGGLPSINTGFEVMNDFLVKFKEGDSSLSDPLYLDVVNRAVNEISMKVRLQDERQELMGRNVIETYENTLKVINQLYSEVDEMKEKLAEVETSSKDRKVGMIEPLSYYPPITYAGNVPVVVFKEISACRYLSSFVLAYSNHLQTVKNKRVKVIIVVGKQALVKNRYKDILEVTKDNYTTGESLLATVCYTTTPVKNLLLHFTKQSDELVIILDRTYEKDPIMRGKATVLYGVSSLSEIKREGLDVSKCIASIRRVGNSLATIKHISSFPTNVDSKLDTYERNFNEDFSIMDDYLNIESNR